MNDLETNGHTAHDDLENGDTTPPPAPSAIEQIKAIRAEADAKIDEIKSGLIERLRSIEDEAKGIRAELGLKARGKLPTARKAKGERKPRTPSVDSRPLTDKIFGFLKHNEASSVSTIAEGVGEDAKVVAAELKRMRGDKALGIKVTGQARGMKYAVNA